MLAVPLSSLGLEDGHVPAFRLLQITSPECIYLDLPMEFLPGLCTKLPHEKYQTKPSKHSFWEGIGK